MAGHPPPGTAPHHPCSMQPPQGMQAKETDLGPHSHTAAPTARGWRTPTARPLGGQSGEGERLTTDAPHNGGRHPPRGCPSATPTASNAGPQGRTLWGRCWVPTPAPTTTGTHGSRIPGCPPQRGWWPGEGQRLTPDAPHNGGRSCPPGDGPPPPPRHAAPTGHAGQRNRFGPPHQHTRAHSTWLADPNSPPSGRAVGGGGAPEHRRPSQRWKAPRPGTPFRHPHSEQRRPQGRTLWGRCWVPTPATTAPGTQRSRNPGCLPQRGGGRGRDSA